MEDQPKKLKIAITGGGTGGHVFPAIAVAQKLKSDNDIEKIFYIGCAKNMEKDAAQRENIEFYSINVSGMPRKNLFKLLFWFFELLFAIFDSVKYLKQLKPDVVFGTGGYVSGAVLIVAKLLSIPYVIHDCDAHPGIVSKFMAGGARAVSISFEQAKIYLKSNNIVLNGNPIRNNFSLVNRKDSIKDLGLDPNKKTILVMGGSQGAKTINQALLNALPVLIKDCGFQIIHQTGAKNYENYIKELGHKYPVFFEKNTVSLSGNELGKYTYNNILANDVKKLRHVAKNFFKEKISGTKIEHSSLGTINFYNSVAGESLGKGKLKFALLFPRLWEIVQSGKLMRTEIPSHNRNDNVKKFFTLENTVKISDVIYDVEIVIAEDSYGYKFYVLRDIKKNVDNQNSAKPEEIIDTHIITDDLLNFNIPNYIVKPFFNNMEVVLNAADIAVSRAGSLSISELNLCGLPSILLPYPYAAADHQKHNAIAMQNAGASVVLYDSDCNSESLVRLITDILNNDEKLNAMKQSNLALAKPDATDNIVELLKNAALCK